MTTCKPIKNPTLFLDIIFCLIAFPAMVFIFPIERWFVHFPFYVVGVGLWFYSVYFANRKFIIPCFFRPKPYPYIGVLLTIVIMIVTLAMLSVELYEHEEPLEIPGLMPVLPKVEPYQEMISALFVIVESTSIAVTLFEHTLRQRRLNQEIVAERDRAQLDLYRAQISPHFMFNTLNSLYGLFLTKNERALEALERYIALMRYLHTSTINDTMTLAEEARYISQYVGLQSLRLNEMTTVDIDIDIENDNIPIPPMLLITFVENCFKHGVSPVESGTIVITLRERNGVMTFSTRNRHYPIEREGTRTGIENCRRRLDLLYPDRHALLTSRDDTHFNVNLTINLNQS